MQFGHLLQRGQQLEAVHPRHHHVQQDEVGARFGRDHQRILAIAGAADLVAVALQQAADDPDVRGLIVDDQDPTRLGLLRWHDYG